MPDVERADEGGIRADRRGFLGWLIGSIIAFLSTALAIPAAGSLIGSMNPRRETQTVSLGKLDDLTIGRPKLVEFTITRTDGWLRTLENRAVWVVRTGPTEATVFNGRCTHLGCAYSWKTDGPHKDQFLCPCHDGTYRIDGAVLGGPPPRRLDTLTTQVKDGVLGVTFEDFLLGIPDKRSV